MPSILVMLLGGLVRIAGQLATQVLIALGIGIVTYTGASAGIDALKAQAISSFSGLPSEVFAILGLLKIGTCLNIVFSAITARMAFTGTSSTIKRFKLN